MKIKLLILPVLLFLAIDSNVHSEEIYLHFDSNGKLIGQTPPGSVSRRSSAKQFSAPEGVILLKDVRYEYYPVFGRTYSDIVRSAGENGPLNIATNKRAPSKSEWSIWLSFKYDYSYTIVEEDNTVHIALELIDISPTDDITITIPALIDDTNLNVIEKGLWNKYLMRFLEHEHDHVNIIRDTEGRKKMIGQLMDISYLIFDYKEESAIERTVDLFVREEASKTGREWVSKIRRRLDEYDRVTDHGTKQEMRKAFFSQDNKNK